MHPLLARRTRAYLLDSCGYAGVALATVPLGLVFQRRGWGDNRGLVLAVSAIPPLVATVIASVQEAGPDAATPGKRRERLSVTDTTGRPLTLGRALLRNLTKIFIPWQLGHLVAIGARFDGFARRDPLTLAATALTYPLVGAAVAAVARGSGRGLHDRVAGTLVRGRP